MSPLSGEATRSLSRTRSLASTRDSQTHKQRQRLSCINVERGGKPIRIFLIRQFFIVLCKTNENIKTCFEAIEVREKISFRNLIRFFRFSPFPPSKNFQPPLTTARNILLQADGYNWVGCSKMGEEIGLRTFMSYVDSESD